MVTTERGSWLQVVGECGFDKEVVIGALEWLESCAEYWRSRAIASEKLIAEITQKYHEVTRELSNARSFEYLEKDQLRMFQILKELRLNTTEDERLALLREAHEINGKYYRE